MAKSKEKAIAKAPKDKMKSVGTPTRSGDKMICEFKTKDKITEKTRDDRATAIRCWWRVYSRDSGVSGGQYSFKQFGEKDNLKISATSDSYTIGDKKDKFDPYPAKGNHIIERIDFSVCTRNKKGTGPVTTKSFNVLNPDKPKVTQELGVDKVIFTITQDHPTSGNRPCSQTEWYMEWGNDNKKNTGFKHKTGTNKQTQFTVEFAKNDFQDMEGDNSFVRLKARGQGWGGDGEWSDWCTHYLFTPVGVSQIKGFGKKKKTEGKTTKTVESNPYYKIAKNRITVLFTPPTKNYTLGTGKLPSQEGTNWEKGGSSYAKAVKKAKQAKKKSTKTKSKSKNTKKTTKTKKKK
jgi:hypothetical protein